MAYGKRHLSRSDQRARLALAAQEIQVPAACDVCVVGGGAAGLVCAITAAESGASVVALERNLRCGSTILATGNGRCNFTNVSLDPKHYNNPRFVKAAVSSSWLDDILKFFRDCGMRWCLEDDRLYPVSRQAASVRSVLLRRARKAHVILAPNRTVSEIETFPQGYRVQWGSGSSLMTRAVVLSVGGGCVTTLAASLHLNVRAESPVLAPLACETSPLSSLNGRRAHVAASAYRAKSLQAYERGEVLLRDYGLSGIVAFDLSRRVSPGDVIALDLLPGYSVAEIRGIVDPRDSGHFEDDAFDGLLDPQIASQLVRLARTRWKLPRPWQPSACQGAGQQTTDTDFMLNLVKGLPYRVTGIAHPELAQVTRGGLMVDQFNPTTLESLQHPSLFTCGEAMDIDGDCGGFNLSWAWKSGLIAGKAAAKAVEATR